MTDGGVADDAELYRGQGAGQIPPGPADQGPRHPGQGECRDDVENWGDDHARPVKGVLETEERGQRQGEDNQEHIEQPRPVERPAEGGVGPGEGGIEPSPGLDQPGHAQEAGVAVAVDQVAVDDHGVAGHPPGAVNEYDEGGHRDGGDERICLWRRHRDPVSPPLAPLRRASSSARPWGDPIS